MARFQPSPPPQDDLVADGVGKRQIAYLLRQTKRICAKRIAKVVKITFAEDVHLFLKIGILHVHFGGEHLHNVVVVQFFLHIRSPFSLLVFRMVSCPMDSSNVSGKLNNMKAS